MHTHMEEQAAEAEESAQTELNKVQRSLKHGSRLLQRCCFCQISAAEV